jgi:hypothetical protein
MEVVAMKVAMAHLRLLQVVRGDGGEMYQLFAINYARFL